MLKRYFEFEKYGASYSKEIIAGLTTFATMSYIIVVNPAILAAAGIPKDASMVATIISAAFGTLLMGVYAKKPFAIAPYMGQNAFVAYTVVEILGYSWQTALGAIFIGGVLFTILTLLKVRAWLSKALPQSLKASFAVGIGLFILLVGLVDANIVVMGSPEAPIRLGEISSPDALLAFLGFFIVTILIIKRVPGAILISVLFISALAMVLGYADYPEAIVGAPPSLSSTFMQIDFARTFQWGFVSVILAVFIIDFVDTMGTLIGLGIKADLLDEKGNMPEIEKPMLADALTTVVASLLGTTTAGAYIESAAGMEAGGRTGFTAIVIAALFLLSLFFSPLVTAIPAFALTPALLIVGIFMIEPIKKIDFKDYTEFIPAAVTIVLMSYTYDIGIGITAGFVLYPLLKLVSGRAKEVRSGMWVLFALSLVYYVVNPG